MQPLDWNCPLEPAGASYVLIYISCWTGLDPVEIHLPRHEIQTIALGTLAPGLARAPLSQGHWLVVNAS